MPLEDRRVEVQISGVNGYVWSKEDVMRLRSSHRILGCLVGSGARFPREEAGLPLLLCPQEVQVLQEEELIRLVFFPSLVFPANQSTKEKAQLYDENLFEKQVEVFKKEKEERILSFADRIVEGKRKKMMEKLKKKQKLKSEESSDVPVIELDREKVIADEISKIQPISKEHQIIQIFTKDPWIEENEKVEARFSYPTGELNKCRLLAFRTLWKKGYYLGEGSKFGGDYLVYLGDPVKFHAAYIVICTERDKSEMESVRPQDFVAKSRLGGQVHKTVLVARLDPGEQAVNFTSVKRNQAKRQIKYHISMDKDESNEEDDNLDDKDGDQPGDRGDDRQSDGNEVEEGFEDEL